MAFAAALRKRAAPAEGATRNAACSFHALRARADHILPAASYGWMTRELNDDPAGCTITGRATWADAKPDDPRTKRVAMAAVGLFRMRLLHNWWAAGTAKFTRATISDAPYENVRRVILDWVARPEKRKRITGL